jgi:cell division protein FtsI/penicillin-binding protein 2
MAAFGAVLLGQLLRWTLWPRPAEAKSPLIWSPFQESRSAPRERGNILDRNGALLVTTGYRWKVAITPSHLSQKSAEKLAPRLAPLLGMSEGDFLRLIGPALPAPADANQPAGATPSAGWPYLALGQVDSAARAEIERRKQKAYDVQDKDPQSNPDFGLPWREVTLSPVAMRVYPEGGLAAHVLGFLNNEPKAFFGIEKYWDAELRGENPFDVTHEGIALTNLSEPFQRNASPDGAHDLVLTIDRAMQFIVEQELRATVERYSADGGTIIVIDPKTGALLASASYPTYNPASYSASPSEVWNDPAISAPYEPGSIFKIITMAAGLNAGVITPDSTYNDTGCRMFGGRKICNLDDRSYGISSMRDVLLHSLNLGTVHINELLDKEFYVYVERFGFGAATGIDLANEADGNVRRPGSPDWSEADLGSNSFGQGIAVTPLQMVSAVSAVANKGLLMKPHAVAGIIANGRMLKVEPYQVRRVIRQETAATLTEMLVEAVDRGAELAQVPGYSVAGKSGTAQIAVNGKYDENATIAGFIGYLPAHDPAFVILVKIVRPRGEAMGNRVAAPAFKRVAEQFVTLAGIPPDRKLSR